MKKSFWLYLLLCVLLLPAAAQGATYHYALIGDYNNWNCDYSSIKDDGITEIITKNDAAAGYYVNLEFGIENGDGNGTGTWSGFDPKGNHFKIVRFTESGAIDCVYPNGDANVNPQDSNGNNTNWDPYSKLETSVAPSSAGGFVINGYEFGNKYVFRMNPSTSWAQATKVASAKKYTIGILSSSNSWTSPVYSIQWNSAYGNVAGGDKASAVINGVKLPDGYFKIVKIDSNNKIVAIYGGEVDVTPDASEWSELYTNPERNAKGEVPDSQTSLDNFSMGDASRIVGFSADKNYTFYINPVSGYVGIEEEVTTTADYTFGLIGEYNDWSTSLKTIKYKVEWNEGDGEWKNTDGWNAVFENVDPQGSNFKVIRFKKGGILDAVYGLDTTVSGVDSSITPTDSEDPNTGWHKGTFKTGETITGSDVQNYSPYSINGYKEGNRYRFSLNPYRDSGWFKLFRPSNLKVYFVDRAGWGQLYCYNYTDRNVTNESDVQPGDYNAAIPGVQMTRVTDETLINGIAGDYAIYEINLPENYNADGSYEFPKLLFSNGTPAEKKSRNLYLVNGGIYTNASSDGQITENEYRPRQFYNYWEDEKEVMAYPNIIHSVKTNVIYVDVPEFYEMAKTATGEQGVAIQIEFEKNGKNFIATGRPGLHTLVPVEIDGHKFLRVEFAQDVIPNGTPVKLSVWENTTGGLYQGNLDVTDESTKVSNINDPKLLEEKKSTDAVAHDSTNKDGEIGSHLYCHQSHCSLNFNNVIFQDGAVYSRSTTQQNIREIVQPDRFYIVNRGKTEDFDNTDLVADEASLEIYKQKFPETNAVAVYRVNRGEGYGDRLVYEVNDVTPDTRLSFVAAFDIIENGVKTRTDWYTYAYANLGEAEENKKMLPGNHYRFWREHTGYYSIDTSNSPSANYYDIMVEWMNSTLYVTPVKVNADFRYGQKNEEDNQYTPVRNGYHVMFAVADDSQEWEPVHIFHDANYGLHDQVEVKMSRRQEWDKYFNNKLNLPAASENGLKPFEDSDATIGHSTANVRAYTAGICLVTVAQTVEDTQFHRSDLQVPVRVIPTPMSIGFTINFEGVRAAREGEAPGHFYMDRYTAENPADGKPFEYEDKNGTVFSPSRMGFFPQMAYTEKLDNEETMQLYWRYMTADEKNGYITAAYADEPVVAAETALDVNSDPYADVVANNNLLRYTADKSKHSSDAVDANGVKYQEVMTAENLKKAGGIVLQIKQNGINSPAYFVHLADDAIATDVEDIEAAEEAEAVYYDLNGMKVEADRLVKGVYVKVSGDKAEKIFVK